jgi:hypothetical protein
MNKKKKERKEKNKITEQKQKKKKEGRGEEGNEEGGTKPELCELQGEKFMVFEKEGKTKYEEVYMPTAGKPRSAVHGTQM